MTVVPAWLGPNKLFVGAKGSAYIFGLFSLTPARVAFAANGELKINEGRRDVAFEWPKLLAGGGCRVRAASQAWIVAFGRPFPDAPAPDREKIEGAAKALAALSERTSGLSDLAGLGVGVLADLVELAQAVADIRKGRRTAEIVKAALACNSQP